MNVDLIGYPVELAWNLTKTLPFPNESVDAVFHEGLLRFFSLEQACIFLKDSYRVLRHGGVIRIGLADVRAYARSYLDDGGGFIESVRPGRPTPLIAFQEMLYIDGCRAVYDFDTLALLLAASGFIEVAERTFGESRIQPPPDSSHRRLEMFYTEAIKPNRSEQSLDAISD